MDFNIFRDDTRHYRHELKYLCTEADLKIIEMSIGSICHLDKHVNETGQYHIRSVYFDDYMDSGYWDNENGNDPREKFRIRTYDADPSRISLECKRKSHLLTNKESCILTRELYDDIVNGNFTFEQATNPLLRKFYQLYEKQLLRPKVIVAYDRVPYIYDLGNVRITFDRNICSTQNIASFFDDHLNARPITEGMQQVLEVKYDEFLPDYIYQMAELNSLRQTAFSKYYLCRKYSI